MSYPAGPVPALPARFAGRPILDEKKCPQGCHACADACPTGAILLNDGAYRLSLDTGRCLFCRACVKACPHQAICFSGEHRLAAARRQDLVVRPGQPVVPPALNGKVRKLFGRSLKLREVSAAGCNACEADINVLGTVAWDLGRFGIQVVAAPRHADGLVITGPVSQNMRVALQKTYEAVPEPKIVIAVGSCAISGGLFADHPETCNGAERITPVDLYIPGCPPHPLTILDGLLRFVGIIAAG
jgi:Ni,Fe-hydrogenase III small subunit/Pyruvate/2-oxoacid:ferredoxin oxidoreductase delta subunit